MNCRRLITATQSLRRAAATQATAQIARVVSHSDSHTPDEALAPAKSLPEVASQPAIFEHVRLHEFEQPFNVNAGTIAALPKTHRMEGAVPDGAALTSAMGVPNALVHVPDGTTEDPFAPDDSISEHCRVASQEKVQEAMRVQQEKAEEAMRVQEEARIPEEEREAMRVRQEQAFALLCPLVKQVARQFVEHFANDPQAAVPAGLEGFGKDAIADLSQQYRRNRDAIDRFLRQ